MGKYDMVVYKPQAVGKPETGVGHPKKRKPKVIFIDNPPKRLRSTPKKALPAPKTQTGLVKRGVTSLLHTSPPKPKITRIGTAITPKKRGKNLLGKLVPKKEKLKKIIGKREKRALRKALF